MFSKTLLALAIAPALTLTSLYPHSTTTYLREQYRPETIILPATMDAGSTVTGTVVLAGTPGQDEVVTLSATSGYFSALPSTVVVYAGTNSVSFSATLSTSASGSGSLTATDAEGSLSVSFNAHIPGGSGLSK